MSETAEWPVAVEGAAWALSREERIVLNEMCSELGWAAGRIAEWTGLPIKQVGQAHRTLEVLGLARFGPLFSEDDGKLRGRGYWLSNEGFSVQRFIRGCRP